MPDITVTITAEEVQVLEAFHTDASIGLRAIARRHIKSLARHLIEESSSELDPRKMNTARLRTEIQNISAEISKFSDRPNRGA